MIYKITTYTVARSYPLSFESLGLCCFLFPDDCTTFAWRCDFSDPSPIRTSNHFKTSPRKKLLTNINVLKSFEKYQANAWLHQRLFRRQIVRFVAWISTISVVSSPFSDGKRNSFLSRDEIASRNLTKVIVEPVRWKSSVHGFSILSDNNSRLYILFDLDKR